jgi:hypothetical protein
MRNVIKSEVGNDRDIETTKREEASNEYYIECFEVSSAYFR